MPTREEYVDMRESFKRLRESELEKIDSINYQIVNLESAKRKCYEVIKENVQQTGEGELTCPHCDCVSMKYEGRTKRWTYMGNRAIDTYVCEIGDCKYEKEEDVGFWMGD